MSTHGHVVPNPSGAKARCGGPGLCSECSTESLRYESFKRALQSHQLRVVIERDELGHKLEKLNAFIPTSVYAGLPEAERMRLARQANVMKEYHDILCERINAF